MGPTLLHILLTSGAIGLGIYLYATPSILPRQSNILRGTVIWIALILALRAIDLLFLR